MPPSASDKPLIGLTCRWEETKQWFYLPREYSEAVAAAGGIPILIPLVPGSAQELAEHLHGFVLCGSPSDVDPARYGEQRHPEVRCVHPDRDETDWRVLEHAFKTKKPVLGICFGLQSLNVYLGGTLIQHIPASVPGGLEHREGEPQHDVRLAPDSLLARWVNGAEQTTVNSSHHQSVGLPGRGLRVAAQAPDGVIEALEGTLPGQFVMGVQWHPERIWEQESLSGRILREFVQATQAWRRTTQASVSPL